MIDLEIIMDRLEDAKASPFYDAIRGLTHIHYGKLGMEEICCKLCGAEMSGLVEHERYERAAMVDGKKVVTKLLVHARYSSYGEIDILMDNGSNHISHVCKPCIKKGLTQEHLEFIYACDLAQWLHSHRMRGGGAIWEVHPQVAVNKPVSFTELSGLE